MDYEYINDVARELSMDSERLRTTADQLKIETLKVSVPPYGVEVSAAISRSDADRLRSFIEAGRKGGASE